MTKDATPATNAPFGTVFADFMATAAFEDGAWSEPRLHEIEHLSVHPGTHVLHYASSCFEGLKAHHGPGDTVGIFRLPAHVARMQRSATALQLPVPGEQMLTRMITDTVAANRDRVPAAPGSLYIRPTLFGTMVNIGAVGVPISRATLYILCSPVGDYFAGGLRPLRIAIETETPRTTPSFGDVKAGANYALALGAVLAAKGEDHADQVLFAPGGEVHETGASNFILISPDRVVTPRLTGHFLEGVTRDSVLTLARDLGYEVEERLVTIDEVLDWAKTDGNEAALAGTAAVLAPVGTLIYKGEDVQVGDGAVGHHTRRLRAALTDIQSGVAEDSHGWLTPIG